MLKIDLVVIDPQNDFMGEDDGSPYQMTLRNGTVLSASLPVKGAVSDMKRVASLVNRAGHKLHDIHVTLDSHMIVDVGHPSMWRDQLGKQPGPYTIITPVEIEAGLWSPRNPQYKPRLLDYAKTLQSQGNYPLMVWPEHCIIGTWGHNVQEDLAEALHQWERKEFANVHYVTKGTNSFTEHYGGLQAEVVDPTDPKTQLNTEVLDMLQKADVIGIAGEASSHCVLSTVKQIADNIGVDHLKKIYLLIDCMSPVPHVPPNPDFPAIANSFLKEMEAKGMNLTTSSDFLS
jgi:nicotinamidase/pyrazinamidase